MKQIVTFGLGGYNPNKPNDNIVEVVELPDPPQQPLDPVGAALSGYQVVAALNAALGIWTLDDAANVAEVSQEHLIHEVLSWAMATKILKEKN